jgi:Uma2 family endonuclease
MRRRRGVLVSVIGSYFRTRGDAQAGRPAPLYNIGMATQPLHHYSLEEYFDFEEKAGIPHEYIDGEIAPAFDGMPAHSLIITNAAGEFRSRLAGGKCRAYSSGPRLMLRRNRNYGYPDVTVVCGELEFSDEKKMTVTNPKLVLEILSPSNRSYDLGEKLRLYWKLPSLTDVILVDQESISIEYWFRAIDGEWKNRILENANDILRIESLECEIPVAAIYDGVAF